MLVEFEADFFSSARAKLRTDARESKKRIRAKGSPLKLKVLRMSALTYLRVLNKTLNTVFGTGVEMFVQEKIEKVGPYAKWFESCDIRVLVMHLDEGSQAYSTGWFLMNHLKINIVVMRDIYHREWNDCKLAISDSDLWWVVMLSTIVLNLPHGPWDGAAFHQKLRDMSKLYLKGDAHQLPLFQSLLPLICADLGIKYDGSAEQAERIFQEMPESDAFVTKGEKVATKRWFSWLGAALAHDKHWHSRLCIMIALGMAEGVYKGYEQVPLWSDLSKAARDALAKPDEDDDGDDGPPQLLDIDPEEEAHDEASAAQASALVRDVKSSGAKADLEKGPTKDGADYLKALRKKCSNTIYVAVEVMCLDDLQNLVRLIMAFVRPVYFSHCAHARDARSPENVEAHYLAQAKGEVFGVLRQVAAQWQDIETMQFVGFTTEFKTTARLTTDSPLVKLQDMKAERVFTLTYNIFRHRLGSQLWHLCQWPGLLALLCSEVPADVLLFFTLLAEDWFAFQDAKERKLGSVTLKKACDAHPMATTFMSNICYLWFSPLTVTTATLIFKMKEMAHEVFQGLGQTKMVEDNFQRMRNREDRDTTNKRLKCMTYWNASTKMGALPLHGREELDYTQVSANNVPKKLEKNLFTTLGHEPVIQTFKDIIKPASWPTYSPQSSHEIPAAMALFRHCTKARSWGLVSQTWKSVFFERGLLFKSKDSDDAFISLGDVGRLMVMAWAVEEIKIDVPNGDSITVFVVGGEKVINDHVNLFATLDFNDYVSIPVRAISPIHFYLALGRDIHSSLGVVLMKTGEPEPIVATGARHGFWKIGLDHLQLLADERGVKSSGPALLDTLVPLIKDILSDVSEEEVSQILQARALKPVDPVEEITKGEDLSGVLEDDQVEQMVEHVEKQKKKEKESTAFKASVSARAATQPKERKKPQPREVQLVEKGKKDLDMSAAELMKPPGWILYDVPLKIFCFIAESVLTSLLYFKSVEVELL